MKAIWKKGIAQHVPSSHQKRTIGADCCSCSGAAQGHGLPRLVRALEAAGENAAVELVAKIGSRAEISRELAYRLYTVCERKKRAQEALSYNGLVQSWPEIVRLARESGKPQHSQPRLFEQG
jgi:adenine-specific DNA methylase